MIGFLSGLPVEVAGTTIDLSMPDLVCGRSLRTFTGNNDRRGRSRNRRRRRAHDARPDGLGNPAESQVDGYVSARHVFAGHDHMNGWPRCTKLRASNPDAFSTPIQTCAQSRRVNASRKKLSRSNCPMDRWLTSTRVRARKRRWKSSPALSLLAKAGQPGDPRGNSSQIKRRRSRGAR